MSLRNVVDAASRLPKGKHDGGRDVDWLEELAQERRQSDPNFRSSEARIEAEDEGYEVYRMTNYGKVADVPVLVAAGDSKGAYQFSAFPRGDAE